MYRLFVTDIKKIASEVIGIRVAAIKRIILNAVEVEIDEGTAEPVVESSELRKKQKKKARELNVWLTENW